MLSKRLISTSILNTDRLVLRPLVLTDSDAVYCLRTNAEVNKFIERPASRTDKNGDAFIQRITKNIEEQSVFYWVISTKENPKLIGTICLWNFNADKTIAEVGYELLPEVQGRGIMTEALKAVLDFGRNKAGFKTLEAFTHKDNLTSKKLLLKRGFIEDKERVDKNNTNNIIFVKTHD